ncbi:hypothetical protein RIF29_17236 [Crotalaria pallida]|uniref:Uncharacterized protein n=1 Tax=Crotalaria pallida TaxID=3830 RepID=A0AAN9FNP8_CROPI
MPRQRSSSARYKLVDLVLVLLNGPGKSLCFPKLAREAFFLIFILRPLRIPFLSFPISFFSHHSHPPFLSPSSHSYLSDSDNKTFISIGKKKRNTES